MLDWITTMQGLLITGGIILLLIAFILFILGNKKENTTNNIAMNTGIANQPMVNNTVNTVDSTNGTPTVNEPRFANLKPASEPLDATTEYDFSIPEEIPVVEPEVTVYGGNNPLENTQIVSEINSEQNSNNDQQVIEPQTIPINEIPTIEIPSMESTTEENKEEL